MSSTRSSGAGSAGSIWAPTRPTQRRSSATVRGALDVDRVALDPDFVDRHCGGNGSIHQRAGAHVELCEMQRTLDHVSQELAPRQRCILMAADIAKGVKGARDVCQYDALAIDRHPLHLAPQQFFHF